MKIPYENLKKVNEPFFTELNHAAAEVVESGWYILGQQVSAFENAFAEYCGVSKTVGVANGLDALILALEALELPAGSEVLISGNSYIACVLSIIRAGLVPVLVEPEVDRLQLDVETLEAHITEKTSAIMAVHMYGRMCDMPGLMKLAHKHELKVVEDCAQAHGASINGIAAGSWGDAGCFSFYPTKNLGCLGDGGAVTAKDEAVITRLISLRNYGSSQKYYNDFVGYNSRLDEMQAAFLNVKLKSLDDMISHKRKLAAVYHEHLAGCFDFPSEPEGYLDAHHIFPVLVDDRENFRSYLLENGIGTEVHYPVPPHHQKALSTMPMSSLSLPITEKIHQQIVSLPISCCHSEDDIDFTATVIKRYMEQQS